MLRPTSCSPSDPKKDHLWPLSMVISAQSADATMHLLTQGSSPQGIKWVFSSSTDAWICLDMFWLYFDVTQQWQTLYVCMLSNRSAATTAKVTMMSPRKVWVVPSVESWGEAWPGELMRSPRRHFSPALSQRRHHHFSTAGRVPTHPAEVTGKQRGQRRGGGVWHGLWPPVNPPPNTSLCLDDSSEGRSVTSPSKCCHVFLCCEGKNGAGRMQIELCGTRRWQGLNLMSAVLCSSSTTGAEFLFCSRLLLMFSSFQLSAFFFLFVKTLVRYCSRSPQLKLFVLGFCRCGFNSSLERCSLLWCFVNLTILKHFVC